MTLKIHNTLSGELEEFKPLVPSKVGMYNCGPTVYDYAHIGNLRAYVSADIMRRTLEYVGYEVKQVVNITDIGHLTSDANVGDDKMVKGLKRENLPLTLEGLSKLADKYEKAFKDDMKALNIETPHELPRATMCLPSEIELVEKLVEKGYTYETKEGIYFDTSKFPDYGKLGGLTPIDESLTRVGGEDKKNPRDFVLWKFSSDEKLSFPSPWGAGFPGWHIECSAMSRRYLGQPFDIHTGGTDHIPIHHNNEIAQSEAAHNKSLANYWLHVAFLNMDGEKMAKSAGTFLTLNELVDKGHSPLAYRYLLLQSHYRTPTTFTWESLEASSKALEKLQKLVASLLAPSGVEGPEGGSVDLAYKAKFVEKLENDFNTPQALAIVWTLAKDKEVKLEDKRTTLLDFDKVLGLGL
ncbi:MAG: cysteine--tRNA ligase [bacterium]